MIMKTESNTQSSVVVVVDYLWDTDSALRLVGMIKGMVDIIRER